MKFKILWNLPERNRCPSDAYVVIQLPLSLSIYPFSNMSTNSINYSYINLTPIKYPPPSICLHPSILQSTHPTTILSINVFSSLIYLSIYLFIYMFTFSSVQSLNRVWLFATPWIAAHQASLSITYSRSLFKLMSIKSVIPSSHLILCHHLLLLSPVPPSIRLFSNESAVRMRWPKYWSFSFSISPSNEHPGLISRMDWLDLLAVQGTLKNLLQHHSSKASIFWHSVFFTVQLSHPYMTTGKTIALTRWTFVGKVMSLLFNMLSRLVITFLPRSKRLLISWLQSPSAVILEPTPK